MDTAYAIILVMISRKLHSNQAGFSLFVIFILVLVGGYILQRYVVFPADEPNMSTSEVKESSSNSKPASSIKTYSLVSQNGYNASGSVAVSIEGGAAEVRISAALPLEFETTSYFARLKGPGSTKELGKVVKNASPTHRLTARAIWTESQYQELEIYVDGDAETVNGLRLPHTAMKATF